MASLAGSAAAVEVAHASHYDSPVWIGTLAGLFSKIEAMTKRAERSERDRRSRQGFGPTSSSSRDRNSLRIGEVFDLL
jgi:hypothetical protein